MFHSQIVKVYFWTKKSPRAESDKEMLVTKAGKMEFHPRNSLVNESRWRFLKRKT